MAGEFRIEFERQRYPCRYSLLHAAFAGQFGFSEIFKVQCVLFEIFAEQEFFLLQVCFESEEKARSLLQNVSALLRPGGYFFGITLDSSTIWFVLQIFYSKIKCTILLGIQFI